MRRKRENGVLDTIALIINFIIEIIIFMIIFSFIGIIIQSRIFTSFGFIMSAVLVMILNFLKIKPMAVYIVSLPLVLILLFFVPKILN